MRKRTKLPGNYRPSDNEEFMNPRQLEYFRQKLLRWRAELLADTTGTLRHLKEESLLKPDLTDRASLETERAIELRTRERERGCDDASPCGQKLCPHERSPSISLFSAFRNNAEPRW